MIRIVPSEPVSRNGAGQAERVSRHVWVHSSAASHPQRTVAATHCEPTCPSTGTTKTLGVERDTLRRHLEPCLSTHSARKTTWASIGGGAAKVTTRCHRHCARSLATGRIIRALRPQVGIQIRVYARAKTGASQVLAMHPSTGKTSITAACQPLRLVRLSRGTM